MSFFALAGEVVSVSISQGSRPGATASCFSTTWGFPEQAAMHREYSSEDWALAFSSGHPLAQEIFLRVAAPWETHSVPHTRVRPRRERSLLQPWPCHR